MTDPHAANPMSTPPETERDVAARHSTDLQRNIRNRTQRERARLLHDWTTAGGSEADFEAAWPSIQAQLGQTRVAEIGVRARNRSLSAYRKRP